MKVVKLRFKETNEEHFFTSYAAIYESFTSEQIGAVIGTIWNRVRGRNLYENEIVQISVHPLK